MGDFQTLCLRPLWYVLDEALSLLKIILVHVDSKLFGRAEEYLILRASSILDHPMFLYVSKLLGPNQAFGALEQVEVVCVEVEKSDWVLVLARIELFSDLFLNSIMKIM